MRLLILTAFVLVSVSIPLYAARRGGAYTDGSGHVVHSKRAPAVMHKVLPPYTGVHVYEGRR